MPWMISTRKSICAECGDDIEVGEKVYYNSQVYCEVDGTREHENDMRNAPKQAKLRKTIH